MGNKFSIETIFRVVDQLSAPVKRMHAGVLSFSRVTDSGWKLATKSADAYISAVNNAVKYTGAAAGALGVGFAYASKAGLDFDQQMANVGAVSLMTRDQVHDLEIKARELGSTTKFTATQVAEGMELLGKAGFENEQIIASIGGVLSAAAAEGMEMAETTSHISNVLKGMNLPASQAAHVADVLALASARTNSSISSLGEAMANVASTARTFNIPLEQVVGSVALLQDVGLDASVAGSALNTMLTKLAAPTEKAKEAMRKLHIEFEDKKTHNMLALSDVVQNLMKAMDGSKGNMASVAFFAELVGMRGQKAAQALAMLNKNIDPKTGKNAIQKLFAELEHASDGTGKATEMARLRMSSVRGELTLLESAVDSVKIDLFDLSKGALRDVIRQTKNWTNANHQLIVDKTQDTVKYIADNMSQIVKWGTRIGKTVAVFYALSLAVKAAQTSIDAYTLASKGIGGSIKMIRGLTVAMGLYNFEAAAAAKAQWGLSAVDAARFGLNASKVGLAINGVTGLLGQAGLLGAAAGVGVAIGLWLRNVLDTDKAISDMMLKLRGYETERTAKLPAGQQQLKNGIIVDENTGEWVNKPMPGATSKTYSEWRAKWQERKGRQAYGIPSEQVMTPGKPDRPGQMMSHVPSIFSDIGSGKMVSPQERVARSVSESNNNTTNKVEVTVKADQGTAATVKTTGNGPIVPKLVPTGAF